MAATTGILQLLSERELRGVMAHELAHVRHRDILISHHQRHDGRRDRHAGQLRDAFLAAATARAGRHNPIGRHRWWLILAPLAASLIQMAISRAREFEADRGGAEISGDPQALAAALQKIHHYAQGIPLDGRRAPPGDGADDDHESAVRRRAARAVSRPIRRPKSAWSACWRWRFAAERGFDPRLTLARAAADTESVLVTAAHAMQARLSAALLLAALGATGCNLLGSEAAEAGGRASRSRRQGRRRRVPTRRPRDRGLLHARIAARTKPPSTPAGAR